MGYSTQTPNFTSKISNTARCALDWRFRHTHKEKTPEGGYKLLLMPDTPHAHGTFTQAEKEGLLEQWASSKSEISNSMAAYREHVIEAPTTQGDDRTSFSVRFGNDFDRSR